MTIEKGRNVRVAIGPVSHHGSHASLSESVTRHFAVNGALLVDLAGDTPVRRKVDEQRAVVVDRSSEC